MKKMGVKFESSSSKVDIIEPQYEKKRIKPRIKYGVLGTIFGFSLGLVGFILVYNVLQNKEEFERMDARSYTMLYALKNQGCS